MFIFIVLEVFHQYGFCFRFVSRVSRNGSHTEQFQPTWEASPIRFRDKFQIVCQISIVLYYISFPKNPFLVTSFLIIHKLFLNHIVKLRVPKQKLNPLGLACFSLLFRSCCFNFSAVYCMHTFYCLLRFSHNSLPSRDLNNQTT